MQELLFDVVSLTNGLRGHLKMADAFLDSSPTFQQINLPLVDDLRHGKEVCWYVDREFPIKTKGSAEYASAKANRHDIKMYAEISFRYSGRIYWPEKRKGVPRPNATLEITDDASISVVFFDGGSTARRRWKYDMAKRSHSVGPLLHIDLDRGEDQNDQDDDASKLPRIPRLPSFTLTPADAIEFVLAELFPFAWKEYRVKNSSFHGKAIKSHADRMTHLAQQYLAGLNGEGWPALKANTRSLLPDPIT
jgi:hypothetical protein